MIEAGRVLERYRVEAVLGGGGMADVYRVRHQTLGSLHALKVLRMHGSTIRARLVLEGQVQATLQHPNIVAVTDIIDVDGAPGLVMEYVDGPSLDVWLHENRPTAAQAERLFRGVVAGVARAHRAGLVHRDLKPGNILVSSGDDGPVAKVADFGLAKLLDEDGGESVGRTRTGSAMGTPQYMAPEQIRDAKNVDQRADIFALGCILYEALTGAPPFTGDDLLATYNAVASGQYAPFDAPPHLLRAVEGCLVVDRDARIPDAGTLRGVLDGGPWARSPAPRAGGMGAEPEVADSFATMYPADELPPSRARRPRLMPVAALVAALFVAGAGGASAVALIGWQLLATRPATHVVTPPAVTPLAVAPPTVPPPTVPPPSVDPPAPVVEATAEAAVTTGAAGPATPRPERSRPTPTRPEAAPPAEATRDGGEASPAPRPGTVRVVGDDAVVRLVGPEGSFGPGRLPAGTYEVVVTFPGRPPTPSPALTLGAGQTVTLRCRANFLRCQP